MENLEKWKELFNSLPRFENYNSLLVYEVNSYDDPELVSENVVMVIEFFPSLEFYKHNHPIELHLKYNETAVFELVSWVEDVDLFPDLFEFKGNWMDSYLKLVEVMKKGWPELHSSGSINSFKRQKF